MLSLRKSDFFITRRKVYYAVGFVIFLVLYFTIRGKYFERSDFLRPVTRTIKNTSEKFSRGWFKKNDEVSNSVDNAGGGGGLQRWKEEMKQITIPPWEQWMIENPHLHSIGDIFDKCDNRTRKIIGKVVLEDDKENANIVKLLMLLNMTFNYRITAGKAHMLVKYKGMVMHDDEYDLCEEAADLETPLYCPFKKGYELRLRNYIKLPSYIPKGHYVVRSRVTDQNDREFGCIEAEVMTGKGNT